MKPPLPGQLPDPLAGSRAAPLASSLPGGAAGAPTSSAFVFARLASATARLTGRPTTFLAAIVSVLVWAATGPYFRYSDTWQLVLNTGSSIVTFLMVFLIQNTQNRDQLALQLKLDELILATQHASNAFAAIEERSDESLRAAKEDVRARAAGDGRAAEGG